MKTITISRIREIRHAQGNGLCGTWVNLLRQISTYGVIKLNRQTLRRFAPIYRRATHSYKHSPYAWIIYFFDIAKFNSLNALSDIPVKKLESLALQAMKNFEG